MGSSALLRQGMAMTPEEFWAILHAVPEEVNPVYRLYYSDEGEPLFYSMEHRPGNYIDIDQATFNRSSSRVRVVNGQLVSTVTHKTLRKLVPSTHGVSCDPRDVCVVVDLEKPHIKWNVKTYEQN
jgi:hypothetical protein